MIEFINNATLTDWFLILIFPVTACCQAGAVYWIQRNRP
jgi:hypothetical protein